MTGSAIWVKCPECRHVWSFAKLPMGLAEAAHLMRAAFCPACGNDSPVMALADDIQPAQQENDMSDTIRAPGPFRLHKTDASRLTRPHPTFEAAETEARRLCGLYPDHSYIIAQEVAKVVPRG